MVKISGFTAEECGINDIIIVNPEHVAITNTFLFVSNFSLVSNFVSDNLSHIFDQNVVWFQIFQRKQSDSVDLGGAYFDFFGVLDGVSILHGQRKIGLIHFLIDLSLVAEISQLLLEYAFTMLLSLLELMYLLLQLVWLL